MPTHIEKNPLSNDPIRTITFRSPPAIPAFMIRECDRHDCWKHRRGEAATCYADVLGPNFSGEQCFYAGWHEVKFVDHRKRRTVVSILLIKQAMALLALF